MKEGCNPILIRRGRICNEWRTIDDLPFTDDEKRFVLEYLARQMDRVYTQLTGETLCSKHYDPLMVDGDIAASYAFDFEDGGRQHKFDSLAHLEKMIIDEMVKNFQECVDGAADSMFYGMQE